MPARILMAIDTVMNALSFAKLVPRPRWRGSQAHAQPRTHTKSRTECGCVWMCGAVESEDMMLLCLCFTKETLQRGYIPDTSDASMYPTLPIHMISMYRKSREQGLRYDAGLEDAILPG